MKFKDVYGDLSGTVYKGNLDCSYNNLTSLEGAPKVVKGVFNCSCNKLTSLEGIPFQKENYTDFSDEEFNKYMRRKYPHILI